MKPILKAITGKEEQGNLVSPIEVLVQFYFAFNNSDIDAMSDNWYQSAV